MAIARVSSGLVSPVMIGLSMLFLFFIILAGVKDKTPFNKTYFLQADTAGIEGAHDLTQWTFLYACGAGNQDCGKAHPAMPFGKAWAANADGAPSKLIGSHGGDTTSFYYYYMWRFSWVFYIMALFFETCAFFASFLACCGRLGSAIGGLATAVAFGFLAIAVSMMTATFVRARHVFRQEGRSAKIGSYAFGFSWGALAALLVALVLLCTGTAKSGSSSSHKKTSKNKGYHENSTMDTSAPKKKSWFARKKNTEAGSFNKVNYEDGINTV